MYVQVFSETPHPSPTYPSCSLSQRGCSHIERGRFRNRFETFPTWAKKADKKSQLRPVSYPTQWSLYSSLDFCVDHLSWQWRPHIAGCKLFLTLLRAKLAVFAKCISGICEEAKNTKMGCFFSSILTTLKWPKKLTHDCFPKIRIDPYIWEALLTCWQQGGRITL